MNMERLAHHLGIGVGLLCILFLGVACTPCDCPTAAEEPVQTEEPTQQVTPIPVVTLDCAQFEEFTPDTRFVPGDTIMTGAVQIAVRSYPDQTASGGLAVVRPATVDMGQTLELRNVILDFNFGTTPLGTVIVGYSELGGDLRVGVNGEEANFQEFAEINDTTVGGVHVTIYYHLPALFLVGAINSFSIGGSELLIRFACPTVESYADVSFFPDGTPNNDSRPLNGDEFSAWGVSFAAMPDEGSIPDYCLDATAVALMRDLFPSSYVSTSRPGRIAECNVGKLEITFGEPIRQVLLLYAGREGETYTLNVYDDSNTPLGTSEQMRPILNELELSEITFTSSSANIRKVLFDGPQNALTAVFQISYWR